MSELLDKLFEEFGIELDTTRQVDSFSAIGYDSETVTFNKEDYVNEHEINRFT